MKPHTFKIMQEPGAQARARRERHAGGAWVTSPMKRVGACDAAGEAEALLAHIARKYPPGHAQYRGRRLQWRSEWSAGGWNEDDGLHDRRGRSWRAVVTLENGAQQHDVYLHAWRV